MSAVCQATDGLSSGPTASGRGKRKSPPRWVHFGNRTEAVSLFGLWVAQELVDCRAKCQWLPAKLQQPTVGYRAFKRAESRRRTDAFHIGITGGKNDREVRVLCRDLGWTIC